MSIDTSQTEPITGPGYDFDFFTGHWHVHNRRLTDALDPECDEWVEFDGTCEARSIMGGLGNVDTYRAPKLPDGRSLEGFTLRLYEPETGLWRLWWASTTRPGVLDVPVVGRFVDGVGEFECADEVGGVPVLVRFRWSDITPTSARWEQFFSFDDGASWHRNWIMESTRTDGPAAGR